MREERKVDSGRMAELFLNRRHAAFTQNLNCVLEIYFKNYRLGYCHIIILSLTVEVFTRLLKWSRYVICPCHTRERAGKYILLLIYNY